MKAHTFIFDAAAYAMEAYITVDKYKDIDRHNQFSKVQTQHELQRLAKIYKEFTGMDIVTELEEVSNNEPIIMSNNRQSLPIWGAALWI